MKTHGIKVIGQTFKEISDIVSATMGARGNLAIIADEFSRPYLTDDGVTVAKECLNQDDPFKKMVATSMIEAANNTEKAAFDGTTLTILLTNEFYQAGLKLIKKGIHPQEAARLIQSEVDDTLESIKKAKLPIVAGSNDKFVRDVAIITTKIPAIGDLVYDAFKQAGPDMNIIIEHDRKSQASSIEHVDGMMIDSGYFSDELRQLCNDEDKFVAQNARIILLAEGNLSINGLKALFSSIDSPSTPLIFFLDKSFDPDTLRKLMETLVDNKCLFMFVFVNDSNPLEVFLDVAAKTGGTIQSAALGTSDYSMEYSGIADTIIIERDKTTILASGNSGDIKKRIDYYQKELDDNKYNTGFVRADIINRRLSSLGKGITKIKLAASTITEYRTIRFKLDDAIGAVRCACKDGVVLGAGKTLYLSSLSVKHIRKALQAPALKILTNAGIKPKRKVLTSRNESYDVNTGLGVDLIKAGIIDSYTSVVQALTNAVSISTSYLKSYILINAHA